MNITWTGKPQSMYETEQSVEIKILEFGANNDLKYKH